MPDTFTANFDFTQPEVGGSDETWGDKLNANWGSLDTLLREIRLSLVGQISGFAATTAPTGWLKCNGQAVSRTTYADLWTHAQASGNLAATEGGKLSGQFGPGDGSTTFSLPDYRGKFLRAWDDSAGVDTGRAIGSEQDSQNLQHNHTASSSNAGGHSHTGTTSTDGSHSHSGSTDNDTHSHSGSTNTTGNHTHTVLKFYNQFTGNPDKDYLVDATRTNATSPVYETSNGSNNWLGTDGNHSHSLNINNDTHNHSLNINSNGNHNHSFTTSTQSSHSHSITVNNDGGSEARPINNAYLVCIKH